MSDCEQRASIRITWPPRERPLARPETRSIARPQGGSVARPRHHGVESPSTRNQKTQTLSELPTPPQDTTRPFRWHKTERFLLHTIRMRTRAEAGGLHAAPFGLAGGLPASRGGTTMHRRRLGYSQMRLRGAFSGILSTSGCPRGISGAAGKPCPFGTASSQPGLHFVHGDTPIDGYGGCRCLTRGYGGLARSSKDRWLYC